MFASEALPAVNALAAAILANAAVAKAVSPDRVRRALGEVVPFAARLLVPVGVKVVAAIELVAALGLVIAETRVSAAAVVASLGLCFALLGILGWARGSTSPCGCFGTAVDRPLGVVNIVIGGSLTAMGALNLGISAAQGYTTTAVILTALGSMLVSLWLHRGLIWELIVEPRRFSSGSG